MKLLFLLLSALSQCSSFLPPLPRRSSGVAFNVADYGKSVLVKKKSLKNKLKPWHCIVFSKSKGDDGVDDEYYTDYYNENSVVSKAVSTTSTSISRLAWVSWWLLLLLNISTLATLLFSRTVGASADSSVSLARLSNKYYKSLTNGIAMTTVSSIVNVLQIPWMWRYSRMSAKLGNFFKAKGRSSSTQQKPLDFSITIINRATRVGISMSMFGMLLNCIGAEQLVGTLTSKALIHNSVLSSSQTSFTAAATQSVGIVDLLVIQANVNTMVGLVWGMLVAFIIRVRGGGRIRRALDEERGL